MAIESKTAARARQKVRGGGIIAQRQVGGTSSKFDVLPRWSPNGTQIAFVQDQRTLKVVSASGGSPRTILTYRGQGGGITALDW